MLSKEKRKRQKRGDEFKDEGNISSTIDTQICKILPTMNEVHKQTSNNSTY